MVRVTGNAEHIKLLQDSNSLYPPNEANEEVRAQLGIYDVFVSYVRGYTDIPKEGLISQLGNIRTNLAGKDHVKAYQP